MQFNKIAPITSEFAANIGGPNHLGSWMKQATVQDTTSARYGEDVYDLLVSDYGIDPAYNQAVATFNQKCATAAGRTQDGQADYCSGLACGDCGTAESSPGCGWCSSRDACSNECVSPPLSSLLSTPCLTSPLLTSSHLFSIAMQLFSLQPCGWRNSRAIPADAQRTAIGRPGRSTRFSTAFQPSMA